MDIPVPQSQMGPAMFKNPPGGLVGVLVRDCLQVRPCGGLRVPLPVQVAVLQHLRIGRQMRRAQFRHRSKPSSRACRQACRPARHWQAYSKQFYTLRHQLLDVGV